MVCFRLTGKAHRPIWCTPAATSLTNPRRRPGRWGFPRPPWAWLYTHETWEKSQEMPLSSLQGIGISSTMWMAYVTPSWLCPHHCILYPRSFRIACLWLLLIINSHFQSVSYMFHVPSFSIMFPYVPYKSPWRHAKQKGCHLFQMHRAPNLWSLRSRWRHIKVASPRGLTAIS